MWILSYIRYIFELPMSFFATRRTGEIISHGSQMLTSIIDALGFYPFFLLSDVSILILVGASYWHKP